MSGVDGGDLRLVLCSQIHELRARKKCRPTSIENIPYLSSKVSKGAHKIEGRLCKINTKRVNGGELDAPV